MVLESILRGVLLPALVAGSVLALGWTRRSSRSDAGWGPALAIGLGYSAGHAAVAGWPPFPPIEATQWLFVFAPAAAALAMIPPAGGGPAAWRRLRRTIVALGVSALLSWPLLQHSWSRLEAAAWIAGLTLATMALTAALESLAGRPAERRLPLALVVGTTAGSIALLLSGSALVAQLAGVLAAVFGALAVAGELWPRRSPAGAVLPGAALLAGLLVLGQHYVALPALSGLLIAASPATVWILETAPFRRLAGWKAAAVAVGFASIPAAAALLFLWSAQTGDSYY